MKRTHLVTSAILLAAAGMVVVFAPRTDGGGSTAGENEPNADSRNPGVTPVVARRTGAQRHLAPPKNTPRERSTPTPLESAGVAPGNPGDPEEVRRAQAVETIAKRRLARLTEDIHLRPNQQRAIFPLLARSAPQYVDSLRVTPPSRGGSIEPLTSRLADEEIALLLDPDQQIDLEIAAAETTAWWSEVIASLERDLVDATGTPSTAAAATAPEPGDDGKEETPAPPTRHEEGNLFDRLNEGGS